MKTRTIFVNIMIVVGIVTTGIVFGTLGRYFYEYLQEREQTAPISEVVAPDGETFTMLPYQPEDAEARKRAVFLLEREGLRHKTVENKLMVQPGQVPLAMDIMAQANLVPGTEHFSFVEILVDSEKEPRRYELQQLLATQNMLANMIPAMSAAVERARVLINPNIPGEPPTAFVTLYLRKGTELEEGIPGDIRDHVSALAVGVEPRNVQIRDVAGKIY